MKKLFSLSFFLLALFVAQPVFAGNDVSITCTSSSCTKSSDLPLFNELNIYPGFSAVQKVTVINNRSDDCNLLFQLNPDTSSSSLSTVQVISLVSDNFVWYSGNLHDLFDNNTHQLGQVGSGQSKEYRWTVSLNQSAGNEFQSRSTLFDIDFNFSCDTESITPVPTSTTNTDINPNPTNDFQCHDTAPTQIPQNLQAFSGQNTVTLTWDEPTDNFTYYLIAYGTNNQAVTYGNPNIGSKGTHSYTVNNLSANTTYYFKIRTGNGCAPGSFSIVISATPGGQVLLNPPPATSFQPGVLGVQTSLTPTLTTTGSVEGVNCIKIFPLAFLLAFLINLIIKRRRLLTFFISLLSFVIDYYLIQNSCFKYRYFYIGNILSFLIPLIFSFKKDKNKLH